MPKKEKITNNFSPKKGSLLIFASGFEDRDKGFINTISKLDKCKIVLIQFSGDLPENNLAYQYFMGRLAAISSDSSITIVSLNQSNPSLFEPEFEKIISCLPAIEGDIFVDISGIPTHAICSALKVVRSEFPTKKTNIVYSEAIEYFPSHSEFLHLKRDVEKFNEIIDVPGSMALEMSENLILDTFSGHRTSGSRQCLVIFPGYEPHRSAGVVENVNPGKLIIIYGIPSNPSLGWRLELSKLLHKRFHRSRNHAHEDVETGDLDSVLACLTQYYDNMYDDHDFIIAPVCSKIQTVASFLFWERFPEVQLVFPLPIGYNPKRSPAGIGSTYVYKLPPKSILY